MPRRTREPWEQMRVPDGWSFANVAGFWVEATRDPWRVKGQRFIARVPTVDIEEEQRFSNRPELYRDRRAYKEVQALMDRWDRRANGNGSNAAFYLSLFVQEYGAQAFGLKDQYSPALSRVISAPIEDCRFYDVNGSELRKDAYFWVESDDGARVEFSTPSAAFRHASEHAIDRIWSYYSPNNPVAMRLDTFQAQFGAPRIVFDRVNLGRRMGG